MDSPKDDQDRERRASDAPPQDQPSTGKSGSGEGSQPITTGDPLISSEPLAGSPESGHPAETTTIETSRVRGPNEAFNPNFVVVPVEAPQPRQARSQASAGGEPSQQSQQKGQKSHEGKDEKGGQKKHNGKEGHDHERGRSDGQHGHSGQPSLTRILIYAGIVALVCGIAGAWGYSYFFGPEKGGKDSSGKSSASSGGSGSSSGSSSSDGSDSGKGTGSSKNSDTSKGSSSTSNSESGKGGGSSGKDQDAGKLAEAQSAWVLAVKQLHEAQEREKAARESERDVKAVLDFLKNTLLSAGRPGDASLTDAFWAAGEGKNVMLRQALDLTDAKAAEAFADRPLGEAAVRELLGQAYLNLGEPTLAVKQYERALTLREAMQGVNNPETAACRNQLAVAYRLARLPAEASRLFDRNAESPSYASAQAVRGTTLLAQKKPAEAELKLRESLMVRQKLQPDDWTTYETRSLLGQALRDQKKYAEAEPLLLSAYEGLKQRANDIPMQDKHRIHQAIERLVKLYEAWGKNDKAADWRQRLEAAKLMRRSDAPAPAS